MRTLLIGMGNLLLRDDGVGIRLAQGVKRTLNDRAELSFREECGVGGLELLDIVAGYEQLIVIDAIRTGSRPVGSMLRFTGAALRETMHLTNVHDTNFATALELGRRLGLILPEDDRIHVFAVEIADSLTFGEQLTDDVDRAFPALLREICAAVQELIEPSIAR